MYVEVVSRIFSLKLCWAGRLKELSRKRQPLAVYYVDIRLKTECVKQNQV